MLASTRAVLGCNAHTEFIMKGFGILTNRKRAVIALIHSIVFLVVAAHGFAAPKTGVLNGAPGDVALVSIYLVVASILAWLTNISRRLIERIYFALCTGSASFGLLRAIFGDPTLPVAQYMRVILLGSAVVFGFQIVRLYSRPIAERAGLE